MSVPTYIYKILPSSSPPPSPLPDKLPVSDLDKSSGFIHLSTAIQLPGTLGRFFQSDDCVHILRLNYQDVVKNIKWEDSKGINPGGVGEQDMFPHLHNDLCLGKNEIESVKKWEIDSKGSWKTAIDNAREQGWFKY